MAPSGATTDPGRDAATAELPLTLCGYAPRFLTSYLRFAEASFGPGAYQARPEYPRWLYDENPTAAPAASDFLLGLDARGEVVACVHKLRMPWRVCGEDLVVPAVHNLMVAPDHRRGLGAMLILGAFARDAHALVPGVTEPLSGAYAKLSCEPVAGRWSRVILDPVVGAARVAAGRALGRAAPPWPMGRLPSVRRLVPSMALDDAPDGVHLGEIAARLNDPDDARAGARFPPEVVRWRFFHPAGPRTLCAELRHGEFFALVSLGRLRGARVARLVEIRTGSDADLARGLRSLRFALLALGGDVLLGFCADERLNARLDAARLPRVLIPPATWIYHRRREVRFGAMRFQGAAGDLGFEALRHDGPLR